MPVKNNYHLPFLGGVNVEVTSNNVKSGTTVLSGEITRVASSGQEITPEVSAFFNAKSSPDIDPKKVCSEIKKSAEKNVSELIESVVEKNSNEQLESVNQNLMEPYEKRAIENLLVSGSKSDADILRRKFETANHAAQIGVINLAMLIEALKATDCTAESIQKLEENLIGLIKNDKLDNQSGFVAFHPGNLYEKVNLLRDDIEKETKKFCKSGVYEFMLDKEVIPAIHNYINRKLTVQNPETIKLIDFRGLMSSGGAEMVKHLVDTVLPKSLNRFEKNVVELRLALHEAEMLRRLIKNDTKPLSEPMPASASSKGQAKDPKNSVINVNVINNNNGFPEACAGSNKSDSIHVNRDVTYSGATGETNVPVSQSPIKENQNGSCFSDQTQQRDMGEIDDGLSRLPQVIMPNSTRLFEPIGPFRMEGQKAFPSQFPYTPTKEDLTEPLTVRRTSVSLQTADREMTGESVTVPKVPSNDEQVVNDGSSPTAERTDLRGGTAETKWQVDVPARISLTGFPILAGPKQHTQLAMTGSRTGVPLQTADREMTGESVTVPKVPSNDEQVVNDGSSPTAKRKDLRGGTAETKWQVDVPDRISLTGFPILAESKRHTQLAMTGPRSSAPLHTADQAKMEMPFSSSENPCQSHPFKNYGKFRVNI